VYVAYHLGPATGLGLYLVCPPVRGRSCFDAWPRPPGESRGRTPASAASPARNQPQAPRIDSPQAFLSPQAPAMSRFLSPSVTRGLFFSCSLSVLRSVRFRVTTLTLRVVFSASPSSPSSPTRLRSPNGQGRSLSACQSCPRSPGPALALAGRCH
jgi:hypothetical protein